MSKVSRLLCRIGWHDWELERICVEKIKEYWLNKPDFNKRLGSGLLFDALVQPEFRAYDKKSPNNYLFGEFVPTRFKYHCKDCYKTKEVTKVKPLVPDWGKPGPNKPR